MKKTLLLLAALSTVSFASTGVHNSTYGNNQIDVETKAFIVNAGLVITASEGTEGTVSDAIKKAVLDHGTLMAGTAATSEVARTVYIRKTNGTNFPEGTVLNIALNADATNANNLVNGANTLAHTLDAKVESATYNAGSGNSTSGAQTLSLTDTTTVSAGDFNITSAINNIPVELKSTIVSGTVSAAAAEGQYSNTSTLAVRFSKIPAANGSDLGTPKADYTTAGTPDNSSTVKETTGIKADGTIASLRKR
ncbi:MAG: hypothetical protein ACRCZO_10465 [Cetobacterium sp.]